MTRAGEGVIEQERPRFTTCPDCRGQGHFPCPGPCGGIDDLGCDVCEGAIYIDCENCEATGLIDNEEYGDAD